MLKARDCNESWLIKRLTSLKKKKLANFVLCSDKRVNAAVCICNSMLTSGLDPSKAMERFWHSCLRSATPKEEKRDVRSMEGLTG